jgi:hypothetical protein
MTPRPHNIQIEQHLLENVSNKYLIPTLAFIVRLHEELIPQLKLFSTFEVYFIKNIKGNRNGEFQVGTDRWPIVLVCISACVTQKEIEITILHELAHAVQGCFGMSFNEKQAEDFAQRYYQDKTIVRFWESQSFWHRLFS